MDLAFGDKAIRYICESQARARSALGEAAAKDLHGRLADLEAIDAITEMDWAPVIFDGTVAWIEFHPGLCLRVEANQAKPALVEGKIDWIRIGRIIIRKIEQK